MEIKPIGATGHASSSFQRKSEPLNQFVQEAKRLGLIPLDTMSAGLCAVPTCLHCEGEEPA